jgi:hypothetical protein
MDRRFSRLRIRSSVGWRATQAVTNPVEGVMADKDNPASPTEDVSDLGQRNRAIGSPSDSGEDHGRTELRDDSRIDRLEQAVTHIESLLEKLYEHQAASATDEIRREMARLSGRLDAIQGLHPSGSSATQEHVAMSRPSGTDPGLARLMQLTRRRRLSSGRGQAVIAGIGALLDLDGKESAAGLLSAYHQARNADSGRNRR